MHTIPNWTVIFLDWVSTHCTPYFGVDRDMLSYPPAIEAGFHLRSRSVAMIVVFVIISCITH